MSNCVISPFQCNDETKPESRAGFDWTETGWRTETARLEDLKTSSSSGLFTGTRQVEAGNLAASTTCSLWRSPSVHL